MERKEARMERFGNEEEGAHVLTRLVSAEGSTVD
jgi:hypothetical protein